MIECKSNHFNFRILNISLELLKYVNTKFNPSYSKHSKFIGLNISTKYKFLVFKGVLSILYLFCFHKYEVPGGKKSRYLGLE